MTVFCLPHASVSMTFCVNSARGGPFRFAKSSSVSFSSRLTSSACEEGAHRKKASRKRAKRSLIVLSFLVAPTEFYVKTSSRNDYQGRPNHGRLTYHSS